MNAGLVWSSAFIRADLRLNVATARQRAPKHPPSLIGAVSPSDGQNRYHIAISRGSVKQVVHSPLHFRVGIAVAVRRRTRSIAVIGRKRSAQKSWDDARASSSFGKSSS